MNELGKDKMDTEDIISPITLYENRLTELISKVFYCPEIKSKEQTDWHQCNINQAQIIDDMYKENTKRHIQTLLQTFKLLRFL